MSGQERASALRRIQHPWLAALLAVVCAAAVLAAWLLGNRLSAAASPPPPPPPPPPAAAATPSATGELPLLLPPAEDPLDTPPVIPVEERARAVFLGDSITRGTSDFASGALGDWSWFYHLVMAPDAPVAFAGGIAENGMLTQWMAGEVWQALSYQPDLLVVLGGTNDIDASLRPEQIIANLQVIRDATAGAGVAMAVCSIPPSDDARKDVRIREYNDALRAWADIHDVVYLDTAAPLRGSEGMGWAPMLTNDGVHPTAEGARLMSQAAATTLRWRHAEGL